MQSLRYFHNIASKLCICGLLLTLGVVQLWGQEETSSPTETPSLFNFPRVQFEVRLNMAGTPKPASVLDAVSIAGRTCATPEELAKVLPCSLRTKGMMVTFAFPQHTIMSAADASFCAIRHHETEFLELAQISHPISLHDGRLYFPLDEFLRVLNETGIVSVEQDESVISLNSDTPSVNDASNDKPSGNTTTIFLAPNDDSPTNTTVESNSGEKSSTSSDKNSKQQQSPTVSSPKAPIKFDKPTRTRYILPDDLKRRGIDTSSSSASRTSSGAQSRATPLSAQSSIQLLVSRLFIRHKFFFAQQSVKKKSQSENITHSKAKQPYKNKTSTNVSSDNDFSSAKKKWAMDVIVLDAGHGGKDGGTIGVAKTKEKDVALAIVKKLGVLLKKELPGTKVVYTRTDDTFVELDRRGQIANENGGKLFVSIHCNATPKKPSKANGFEVYILRPGRNEDAVHIAEVENSVIKLEDDPKRYKPLTDEQFIVVSMAQSAFVKYSDMAAAMITAEVKKLKDIGVRGVNQAGFLVLVGASMPNMLIETGFLSNKKEEKFLKSSAGQTKLALAICRAIKAYRTRYEAQMRGVAVKTNIETKPEVNDQTGAKSSKISKNEVSTSVKKKEKTTQSSTLKSHSKVSSSPTSSKKIQ